MFIAYALWLLAIVLIAALNYWTHQRRKRITGEQREKEAAEADYELQQW